ncbi:(deoxy)nucleoside triphosphate pyrophosphohydrolase [Dichelobacter nodosus]|uniref:8-oxo-dGTP diphosphatase n=1 Tax=Dichelobacter nodosus (strain VCS1703A) TaxID=246195 RepID=A5EY14_DICNV|nr:(deoxy)nucleoside triphosphate pyrophosphohydrolase [Dichelobacter nodosus]ABQ13118.1 NUDIX hydrolase domain protein [Dichelobacter nodosus VCS1703A]AXM45758.1 (deoxy)nucleoside triphosphate pyrophosphohydrolase [Dichelobacter nodosus]KNZ39214.1 hypothetical protein AKG33_05685 [Dichelobacter nodosus]TGA64479.1 (deoxy)nucleoside triphosphate pyrophosphohydrolase [Dichelobacter nodosus]
MMIEVVAGILCQKNQKVLIATRPAGKFCAGFWEFPGGKVEAGERHLEALIREFQEELGIDTRSEHWQLFYQGLGENNVALSFYFADCVGDYAPQGLENQEVCWAEIAQLNPDVFPKPNSYVIELLKQKIKIGAKS